MATAFAPPHQSGRAEQDLIAYLEGLRHESRVAKELADLQDADLLLGVVRGQATAQPRGMPAFFLNLLQDHLQRKAGLLTDARPILEVVSGNPTLKGRTELLTKCQQALWDETTWQETLTKGIAQAMILGCNVGMIGWDPMADQGRGDIRARWFDPRAVFIDPAVTLSTELEQAEFVCTEELRSCASLIEQFGPRAEAVKPDGQVSSYPDRGPRERGLLSPASGNFRQRSRRRQVAQSQVPRAFCRHYRFKDWPRGSDGKPQRYERVGVRQDGTPILKGRRRVLRHVVVAGGTVLVDEPAPEWHQSYPIEVLDWGMNTEDLWGLSEIKQLRSAQDAMNRLAQQMLRNTSLLNNFIVVGDHNAMAPDQWDAISNRPAVMLRKRPNTQLEFRAPPSLPPYLFTMIEFLMKAIDLGGGMNESAKGSGSPSQSGVAVEALQIAAQTVIRLTARRLEKFTERLFTKAIALIYQYYPTQKVLRFFGPGDEILTYTFDRADLTLGLSDSDVKAQFRDFVLSVRPYSSLNATKVQKAVLSGNLYTMGLIPGSDVLKASEWPDPEQTIQEARRDQIERTQVMMAAQAMGGAPQPQGDLNRTARGQSAARMPASFPAGGQGQMAGG